MDVVASAQRQPPPGAGLPHSRTQMPSALGTIAPVGGVARRKGADQGFASKRPFAICTG
jgi:hypothetical protein